MIKIENTSVYGIKEALRAMRNPLNSWHLSDSKNEDGVFTPGKKDLELARKLANAGDDHGKLTRMIVVYADITAPLFFWKEADTYKIGTVRNSCSTMHTLLKNPFTIDDFSRDGTSYGYRYFRDMIDELNRMRDLCLKEDLPDLKESMWRDIVQMLPSSYNQKATWMGNYQVLHHMYEARKTHKLSEWHTFCDWVKQLPYYNKLYGEEHENN